MTALVVDFCGELHEVPDGATLSFGRAGDLVIDDANPYMHRLVGQVRSTAGVWWLDNLGASIELVVVAASGSRSHLSPAVGGQVRSVALVEPEAAIQFQAGSANYRIDVRTSAPVAGPVLPSAPVTGNITVGHGVVSLTDDERLLVAVLARPLLADPTAGPDTLPANREVAARLGWRITTYNRKLDRLCDKLRRAGVAGLQGERGAEATNRRWALVVHAVTKGLVSLDDLPTGPPGPPTA